MINYFFKLTVASRGFASYLHGFLVCFGHVRWTQLAIRQSVFRVRYALLHRVVTAAQT